MANKSFGTKQLDLTGASGSPIITSPSDLSINATTVAISTNISVGGYFASNVNVGAGYSVGIGTTIPSKTLSILSPQSVMLQLEGTSNSARIGFKVPNTIYSPTIGVSNEEDIQFRAGGNERLRITSAGKVGIGTTIPQQQLTVENDATHCLVRVISNNLNESGIDFGDTDDGDQGKVRYNNTDSYMRFEAGATEKLRINGASGISTTTFAGSDEVILNAGGGNATAGNVRGVINMGTSYKDGGHTDGSGDWSAVKLFLYKDPSTTDNVLSLIHI